MQSYYEEHMKALIDYDREHNTELVNTLECYFRCNRNLRVTAETLFIHKNSAIYRIRKIESLTGSSISAGADADLVIFNEGERWRVGPKFVSKATCRCACCSRRFSLPIMHKTAAVFLRLFMQVVGPNFQKLCV